MDIIEEIGMDEMLCQLAEECCELGKAALKYHRVLVGRNPTPVTEREALDNLTEESQDVQDCLMLLEEHGIKISDLAQSARKMERWAARIEAKGGEEKPDPTSGLTEEKFLRRVMAAAAKMKTRLIVPRYVYLSKPLEHWLLNQRRLLSSMATSSGAMRLFGLEFVPGCDLEEGVMFKMSDKGLKEDPLYGNLRTEVWEEEER